LHGTGVDFTKVANKEEINVAEVQKSLLKNNNMSLMQVVKLGKKKGDFYSIENNIKKR